MATLSILCHQLGIWVCYLIAIFPLKDTFLAFVKPRFHLKIYLNYEPLSRDENETRRNVNAGHVTMTIIKCIMQYRWRIKTRLNVVYKIKTMLKCLFIFIDQNETKRNVITLFRLVSRVIILQYFCFMCLNVTSGLSGLPGFRNKTRPITTQN